MKLVNTCLAAAAATLAPMLAHAGLAPGQYDLAGIQQLCLVADDTWYSTTFPDWGGRHWSRGPRTFIFGNYDSGDGNDSMVFRADNQGSWTEWRDHIAQHHDVMPNVSITFVKPDCDPPAAMADGADRGGNPLEAR